MPLLPALFLLLLTISPSTASFTCTGTGICVSTMGYIVPNLTTYEDLYARFKTSTLEDLLCANNVTASQEAIPAQTTVIIPLSCRCADNIGQSDQKPIYTVIDGDTLDTISRQNFGGFVTYQEVQRANLDQVPNKDSIFAGQRLWIPLPCSCDKVDDSDVMHFAYSVDIGETISQIASKYGVSESTLLSVNNITDGDNLQMVQILDVPRPQGSLSYIEIAAPPPPSQGPGASPPPSPGSGPPAPPSLGLGPPRPPSTDIGPPAPPNQHQEPTPQPNPGPGHTAVITGAVLTIVVVAVLVWLSLSWYRWKCKRDSFAQGIASLKRFEYSILAVATDNFSEENRLGEGNFGAVYRGSFTDDNGMEQKVAVKKMKDTTGENKDFHAELKATRHINLVSLKGWGCSASMMEIMCSPRLQNVKLFLVYELVSNHDLGYHLRSSGQVLSWTTRYQIVKGIVSALHYLHHENNPYIVHRDIKPSNILLDEGFNPKLADFGLSRIASHNNTTLPTQAIGSAGYIDPQCRKDGPVKFGPQSDVYSFGIVLLDIACTDKSRNEVWELFGRGTEPQVEGAESQVEAAADAKLCGVFDRKQMKRVVSLGLRCSNPDGAKRPYMRDAMIFLEQDTE